MVSGRNSFAEVKRHIKLTLINIIYLYYKAKLGHNNLYDMEKKRFDIQCTLYIKHTYIHILY